MAEQIQKRLVETELKEAYLDYAMSVITGRALPDVHDGLKPVHRRILFTMQELGLQHNKQTKKSARIVGDCMGKYHPHGDLSVYDALARMAQDFSLRYPLVIGQGNWGSVDGDPPAAQRYTEAKLSKIAEEMLKDIEKNTVIFNPNFDNSMKEPLVLPGKIPNLLLNGTSGIAVGMTSNIPPHNMTEVCEGIIAMIENPEIDSLELMKYIKGPDFPTAGMILGTSGIKQAYTKSKGKITLRAKVEIEEKRIIVTEIPYQVNKSLMLETIANLVRDKRIEGISDIRDESNKKGIRVVIELKKNANAELILNQLYKHSQLQTTFGIVMLALVAGQPKRMSLRNVIHYYIQHRKRIITRKTKFELEKAEDRAHILEGLLIALEDIDNIIKGIKASKNVEIAREFLMNGYKLTEKQANAILEMRLQKLTGLEQEKIKGEHAGLLEIIAELSSILASEERVMNIIKEEVLELKEKYGDERRTEIIEGAEVVEDEDLIKEEDVVITLTNSGYIKRTSLDEYNLQKRGGTGVTATKTKEEDFVEHLFISNTHSYLLCFTNLGKLHAVKAYQVPGGGRYAKGMPIVNLLQLGENEKVATVLPVKKFASNINLMFCTKKGLVKKTSLETFSKPRKGGVIAIKLNEEDELVNVKLSNGQFEFLIASIKGQAVRFKEEDVRVMGRNSSGVRGIKLVEDEVIGMEVAKPNSTILTITENGYGKRTNIEDYRLIKRGGKGVRNIKVSERNGNVIGIKTVLDTDELMFMTENGTTIRTSASGISIIGRNTQGVRIIKLRENDRVSSLARIISNGESVKED
jgi:DNA gyrase subunit A